MMSQEQLEFKNFIETHVPAITKLFDWNRRELVFSRVDAYLKYASTGEDMLTRFFTGIWLHDNHYHFDMIDALKRLDTPQLDIIKKWLKDPIWP